MVEYQIDFTIQARGPDDDDFRDVGFGSSGAWGSVDQAVHIVNSIVQNREWETGADMPDPRHLVGSADTGGQ